MSKISELDIQCHAKEEAIRFLNYLCTEGYWIHYFLDSEGQHFYITKGDIRYTPEQLYNKWNELGKP